jgi:MFS family permease
MSSEPLGTGGRRTPRGAVRRAIRLSYLQVMLGAIYGASTGGMFLIGYALRLGATDVQIGLMSTVPMLCIGVQLATALLIERGVSRRRLTFLAALLNVAGWGLIILIPYAAAELAPTAKVGLLIAILTVVTLFAYVSGNARGSWVGDLIPARIRGSFFGRTAMFGGIIASVFAIFEGAFLDVVKRHGLTAFSALFGFGMIFGVASALLFLPQHDPPTERHHGGPNLFRLIRATFANRQLRAVTLFAILWGLQGVAGPFYATYMLRDLGMPFVGVGFVNATFMLSFLLSGPFWGRAVDRYGCRPVLTACSAVLGAVQFSWAGVASPRAVYTIIPAVNLFAGASAGGVSVALSTLLYKATPAAGRAMQFAVYSVVVVLAAAPLPAVGGHLPGWLTGIGLSADLRFTFFAAGLVMLLSACVSRRIGESGSYRAREMLRHFGAQLAPALLRWRA